VGNSQVLHRENCEGVCVLSLNKERLNLLESSMMFLVNIVNGVGVTSFSKSSECRFDNSIKA